MLVRVPTPAFVALPVGASVMFVVASVAGPGHVLAALVCLSGVEFVVGSVSALPVAFVMAGIGWLFLSGCAEPGQVLSIHGVADVIRLLVVAGAGLAGWLIAAGRHALAIRTERLAVIPYPGTLPQVPVPR